MPNVTTYSIKYIDTAATIHATTVPLGKIVWSGMLDNATLVIDDANGAEALYRASAALDFDYFEFDFNGMVRSFKVTTISSGVLLLYPYLP